MLGFIREKASSFLIKASLGVIILVFIFFFGYTSLRSRAKTSFGPHAVALVNGVPINALTLEYYADQQRKRMEEQFKGQGLPSAWNDFIRKNTLSSLVNRELLAQLAVSMKVELSDEELANYIVSLWPTGEFDELTYKTRHLPYFRDERGEDFEEMIRKQLLINKFQDSLSQGIVVTEDDVKSAFLAQESRITLDLVISEEKEDGACAVAKTLNTKWSTGGSVAGSKNKITKEAVTAASFKDLRKKLPLSLTEDQMAQIMALGPVTPFLKEPINLGNNSCLIVKVLKKVLPDLKDLAKKKESLAQSLKEERARDLENSLLSQFEQKSEVRQNL